MAKRDNVKYLNLNKDSVAWRRVLTEPHRCRNVNDLFIWVSTEEGNDYWHDVYLGRVPFEDYQEKLFRVAQHSKDLTVALSDLFFTVDEKDLWE